MADKTCSLLEFITFCFEKNEVSYGGACRYCPYNTPKLAREQYERLVREAIQHFASEPPKDIPFGSHWPERLAILHKGCAVKVLVAAERGGPAWTWGDSDRDWEHVNASDDWTVLYESTKQTFK